MGYQRHITGPYYDSEIDTSRCSPTRNADFYLTVKTEMVPFQPNSSPQTITDSFGRQYNVREWPPEELRAFRREFKRLVEHYLDGQLYLVPSRYWGYEFRQTNNLTESYIPNLKLGLRLRFVERGEQPHLRVKCVRLSDKQQFHTSFVNRRRSRSEFRMELDNLDIGWKDEFNPGDCHQIACVHEFGHYLGLAHVNNPYCQQNSIGINEGVCYDAAIASAGPTYQPGTSHQGQDLMGMGMRVEEWHAWPWQQQIGLHLDQQEEQRLRRRWGYTPLTWSVVRKANRPAPQRQVTRHG